MNEQTSKTANDVKSKAGKSVPAPKNCVASFVRKRDNQRIYVFPRRGEGRESAISRVLRHNGSEGVEVQNVTT